MQHPTTFKTAKPEDSIFCKTNTTHKAMSDLMLVLGCCQDIAQDIYYSCGKMPFFLMQ